MVPLLFFIVLHYVARFTSPIIVQKETIKERGDIMLYLLVFIAASLMAILSAIMGWTKIFMICCVLLFVFNSIIKTDASNK